MFGNQLHVENSVGTNVKPAWLFVTTILYKGAPNDMATVMATFYEKTNMPCVRAP